MEKLRDLRDAMLRHWSPCYLQTPCHASGHLVICHECYGFERAFFTLRYFLPYTASSCFQGLPGSRQFNLKVSRASCRSSKHSPSPTICLNHSNPQKRYDGGFYLRVRLVGYMIKNLPLTRFELSVHIFYPFDHRALQNVIN